ncbi:magnesium and cobalt transport protein CorA [Catelliglobosispora koreensis]|uniref:magnesium and cobalt transport protein CorA n=1 Tax=Catelliglobosispora koreensis TaxID=129052 RepID=UPI00036DCE52|nr:magnesium and cobalt transport protein CorA [Catelliglobosispora koreensis]
MTDEQQGSGDGRYPARRSWSAPLLKVIGNLAGEGKGNAIEPVQTPAGSAVVDCAVYLDGKRKGGRLNYRDAYEQAKASEAEAFVWLGIHEPSVKEFAEIAAVFGLDDLAIEHAQTRDSRPTIQRAADSTFLTLRTTRYVEHPELTETSEVVETGAIMIFVGPRFVITLRRGAPGALGPIRADLEGQPDRLAMGPWAVAHAICDRLVDTYLDVSDAIETDLDALEAHVFAPQSRSSRIAHIYQLKRELMEFKRAVAPLQRPLAALIDERGLVPKEIRRYLRDVNDHLIRVVERIAAYDDLIGSIMQARLAQITVDQNNDMRKIASWAAIAATQTAIAGIYGMNFAFMPELQTKYGYPAVLAIMFIASIGLYRVFRKSGWL